MLLLVRWFLRIFITIQSQNNTNHADHRLNVDGNTLWAMMCARGYTWNPSNSSLIIIEMAIFWSLARPTARSAKLFDWHFCLTFGTQSTNNNNNNKNRHNSCIRLVNALVCWISFHASFKWLIFELALIKQAQYIATVQMYVCTMRPDYNANYNITTELRILLAATQPESIASYLIQWKYVNATHNRTELRSKIAASRARVKKINWTAYSSHSLSSGVYLFIFCMKTIGDFMYAMHRIFSHPRELQLDESERENKQNLTCVFQRMPMDMLFDDVFPTSIYANALTLCFFLLLDLSFDPLDAFFLSFFCNFHSIFSHFCRQMNTFFLVCCMEMFKFHVTNHGNIFVVTNKPVYRP